MFRLFRIVRLFAYALATGLFALLPATPALAQNWSELNANEKKVLAPLQQDWNQFTDIRKRKWREIAARYPTMPLDQQRNLSERMQGWIKLSPEERRKAREQFQELQQLPAEKRAEATSKWNEYRNLTPEQREELRKKAADKGTPKSPPPAANGK